LVVTFFCGDDNYSLQTRRSSFYAQELTIMADRCSNGYDRYGNCYNSWDSWARWVVLGVIIVAAIVLFFLFS